MSDAIDDLTSSIMAIVHQEEQKRALKVPLDRFAELPGADEPVGTHNALLRTLHELQSAGLVDLLNMKVEVWGKGIHRLSILDSGTAGVAITPAGIEWVERFADEGESRAIGFSN